MASTVLHNVGNVLTSVTIAANTVESVVDQSSVTLSEPHGGTHENSSGGFRDLSDRRS